MGFGESGLLIDSDSQGFWFSLALHTVEYICCLYVHMILLFSSMYLMLIRLDVECTILKSFHLLVVPLRPAPPRAPHSLFLMICFASYDIYVYVYFCMSICIYTYIYMSIYMSIYYICIDSIQRRKRRRRCSLSQRNERNENNTCQ